MPKITLYLFLKCKADYATIGKADAGMAYSRNFIDIKG